MGRPGQDGIDAARRSWLSGDANARIAAPFVYTVETRCSAGDQTIMFDTFLKWLTGGDLAAEPADPLQLAIVALLVQAAEMDDHFDAAERATIERILAARFKLTPPQIAVLIDTARRQAEAASQLLPFTRLVVDRLGPPERVQVVEMLYDVVYADGTLDADEDALVRRIAGLIYVPDVDRGGARRRARERRGLPE
jgi:uncharacterized tellurite resistance protein B-like protein